MINECLIDNGFKKKRNSYFKESQDFLKVVTVRKSQYSNLYYFSFGIAIKGLLEHSSDVTSDVDCHVQEQFSFTQADGSFGPIFIPDENNEENLRKGIHQETDKYLSNVNTIDDLLDLIKKYPDLLDRIGNVTRKYIGITEMM